MKLIELFAADLSGEDLIHCTPGSVKSMLTEMFGALLALEFGEHQLSSRLTSIFT